MFCVNLEHDSNTFGSNNDTEATTTSTKTTTLPHLGAQTKAPPGSCALDKKDPRLMPDVMAAVPPRRRCFICITLVPAADLRNLR